MDVKQQNNNKDNYSNLFILDGIFLEFLRYNFLLQVFEEYEEKHQGMDRKHS